MLKSIFFVFSLLTSLSGFATAQVTGPVALPQQQSEVQQYRYEKPVNLTYTGGVNFRTMLGESDFRRLEGYNYSSIEIYGSPATSVEGSIQMQFYPQGVSLVNWFNAQTRKVAFVNLTPDVHHNTLAQGGFYFSSAFNVERVVFTFSATNTPNPPNPAVLVFTKKLNLRIAKGQQYLDSFNDSRIQGCQMVEWQFDAVPVSGQKNTNYIFEFTSGNTQNRLGTVFTNPMNTRNAWSIGYPDNSSMGSYGMYDYFKFVATDQDIIVKDVSLKCIY